MLSQQLIQKPKVLGNDGPTMSIKMGWTKALTNTIQILSVAKRIASDFHAIKHLSGTITPYQANCLYSYSWTDTITSIAIRHKNLTQKTIILAYMMK